MYKAVVAKIHTSPIEGSDNIVLGHVLGYNVIVSKDTVQNQLGVFFEDGGQLDLEFAKKNNLLRKDPDTGLENPKGYFEPNRRVRAIKMRGVKSEGFWCPLDEEHFGYTNYELSLLKEGDQFDELNGHKICEKYYTPAQKRSNARKAQGPKKPESKMFLKHYDTEPLKRHLNHIPPGAIITITEKLHGTSHRYGHVIDVKPIVRNKFMTWVAKILNLPTETKEWVHLNGTRNVVIRDESKIGYHGPEEFRFNHTKNVSLKKGETLYGEIIGFDSTGKPIMSPQDTTKLKDKRVAKQFPSPHVFNYALPQGQSAFYVYRITHTNEDGQSVDLSWNQVQQRCTELGLNVVPLLDGPFIFDADIQGLMDRVEWWTEAQSDAIPVMPSRLDPNTLREGVVVRVEHPGGIDVYKNKSITFGLLEGYLKESDDFVDTEEDS
jgi:hypothetical protein